MSTLRYAAYLASDPDPTQGSDLVSGASWATSYAVTLASETAPTVTTVDHVGPELTGLSPSTAYKYAVVDDDGGTYDGFAISGSITTGIAGSLSAQESGSDSVSIIGKMQK